MRATTKDMLAALVIAIFIGFGYWLGRTSMYNTPRDTTPITCPTIGVVVINDALVVVRECADGSIVRDYPWRD